MDHFRNIQLDNELERKLKEVLNVNMNEIQFKSEVNFIELTNLERIRRIFNLIKWDYIVIR